jgi:hypothetical protein
MRKALSFVGLLLGVPVLAFVVFVNLFPAAAQTPKTAKGDESVAAGGGQRFEDKAEMSKPMLLDYGRHLDNRDFAATRRFSPRTDSGSAGFGTVAAADIKAFMEKGDGARRTPPRTTTALVNFVITVTGQNTATALGPRWAFVVPGPAEARGDCAGPAATSTRVGRENRTLVESRGASPSNDNGRALQRTQNTK